jgi:hypothetical protein
LASKEKTFVETEVLNEKRMENEQIFVDFAWMSNKHMNFLLVLTKNNTILIFINDVFKDTIRLDFSSMNIRVLSQKRNQAKDIDDTFGFGPDDNEMMGVDDGKEHGIEGKKREQAEARVPLDVEVKCITSTDDGFMVAASGGLITQVRFPELAKYKDASKKPRYYYPNNFQIGGIKEGEAITYMSVDSKFKLFTFVLQTEVPKVLLKARKTILHRLRSGEWPGRRAAGEVLPRGLPQLQGVLCIHEQISQHFRDLGPGRVHPALGLRLHERRREALHPRGPEPREPRLGLSAPARFLLGRGIHQRFQSLQSPQRKLLPAQRNQPGPVHPRQVLLRRAVPFGQYLPSS